jgi:hypothetical protein
MVTNASNMSATPRLQSEDAQGAALAGVGVFMLQDMNDSRHVYHLELGTFISYLVYFRRSRCYVFFVAISDPVLESSLRLLCLMDRRDSMAVCKSAFFIHFDFGDSFPIVLLSQATQVGDIILSVDSESVVGMVPSFSPHYVSSPSFRRATACVDDSSANSRSSWHLRLAQFLVAFNFNRVHVRDFYASFVMLACLSSSLFPL